MTTVVVEFVGRTLRLPAGAPLNRALFDAGVPVESPCGGRARCGRCRVRLSGPDLPPPVEADRTFLNDAELAAGFRLSCQHHAVSGLTVEVLAGGVGVTPASAPAAPAVTVAAHAAFTDAARKAGLMEAEAARSRGDGAGRTLSGFPLDPLVRKVAITVEAPAHEDYRGDWERLNQALPETLDKPPLDVLRQLPRILRHDHFRVTVAAGGRRCLAVEPGDTTTRLLGLAFDIGTTTLAASLVDLTSGAELAIASGPNPQAAFGADLMTRLGHAFQPEGRRELQERIVAALNGLVADLCRRRSIEAGDIHAATVVGNTAMHHLFLGLEVEQLGLSPYVPAVTDGLTVTAAEAGLAIHPHGLVYTLPCIAGFAGADIAAVLLATRLWEAEAPVLVIDLGTNGEILLGDRTGILACSAPAGPAFEGGAIARGMRAVSGAIQGMSIDEDVRLDVIGGGPALGLCGSGLVDAVAALLRVGVLDPSGRYRVDRRGNLPPAVARRLGEGGEEFLLATDVALTQKDVRQLQLAKGAIRAGADVLLAERGLRPEDLSAVLLAGTFGNYIREENALAIGLLPPVPVERVRPIGNAAAAGARLALLSREARETLERVVRQVRHVPLATRPDFQEVFIESTTFPG